MTARHVRSAVVATLVPILLAVADVEVHPSRPVPDPSTERVA